MTTLTMSRQRRRRIVKRSAKGVGRMVKLWNFLCQFLLSVGCLAAPFPIDIECKKGFSSIIPSPFGASSNDFVGYGQLHDARTHLDETVSFLER